MSLSAHGQNWPSWPWLRLGIAAASLAVVVAMLVVGPPSGSDGPATGTTVAETSEPTREPSPVEPSVSPAEPPASPVEPPGSGEGRPTPRGPVVALPREGWSVAASRSTPAHQAAAVADGDPATYWSSGRPGEEPTTLVVGTGRLQRLSGVSLVEPRLADTGGATLDYTVWVGRDRAHWTRVGEGSWPHGAQVRTVRFAPQRASYVRVTITGGQAVVAELDLLADPGDVRRG